MSYVAGKKSLDNGPVDPLLIAYLRLARAEALPKISPEAANVVVEWYVGRRKVEKFSPHATRTTPRQAQAVIRISQALAMLKFGERRIVTEADVRKAIELKESSQARGVDLNEEGADFTEEDLKELSGSERVMIHYLCERASRAATSREEREAGFLELVASWTYGQKRRVSLDELRREAMKEGMTNDEAEFQQFITHVAGHPLGFKLSQDELYILPANTEIESSGELYARFAAELRETYLHSKEFCSAVTHSNTGLVGCTLPERNIIESMSSSFCIDQLKRGLCERVLYGGVELAGAGYRFLCDRQASRGPVDCSRFRTKLRARLLSESVACSDIFSEMTQCPEPFRREDVVLGLMECVVAHDVFVGGKQEPAASVHPGTNLVDCFCSEIFGYSSLDACLENLGLDKTIQLHWIADAVNG